MNSHDPLCPNFSTHGFVGWTCGYCTLIHDTRMDERNTIKKTVTRLRDQSIVQRDSSSDEIAWNRAHGNAVAYGKVIHLLESSEGWQ